MVTTIVYVTLLPGTTLVWLSVLVIWRSACVPTVVITCDESLLPLLSLVVVTACFYFSLGRGQLFYASDRLRPEEPQWIVGIGEGVCC